MKLTLIGYFLLACVAVNAQNQCKCSSPPERSYYLQEVHRKLDSVPCNGCEVSGQDVLLIYDAKCRKFTYSESGVEGLTMLDNLNDLKLHFKKPFIFKIINLNRYLYNVNLGNSDVAFTSTESAVMQQYLTPGATNGQITPATTYVAGGSANGGDNIFNLIQGFKPSIDKILISVDDVTEMLKASQLKDSTKAASDSVKTINTQKSSLRSNLNTLKNSLSADQKRTSDPVARDLIGTAIDSVVILNQYNASLDNLGSELSDIQSQIKNIEPSNAVDKDKLNILYGRFLSTFNQYRMKATAIVRQIEYHQHEQPYKKLYNDPNFSRFEKSVKTLSGTNPMDLVSKQSPEGSPSPTYSVKDTSVTKSIKLLVDSLNRYGLGLKAAIDSLEKYYNRFLDMKIIAYSLCTDSFPCCDIHDKVNTYTHFDSLLSNITNAYLNFRKSASLIKKAQSGFGAENKGATDPTKVKSTPVDFTANTSDITFQNGKITGVTLHQLQDTSKSKVAATKDSIAAAIAAIDSLWFSFEKSVSPDFMMRQILFVRNMVEENMSYTSPPIFPYGDRMGLVFQIVASDSAKKNGVILDHTTTESLDFLVVGRSLFSFSAGTFVGLSRSLRSPTYEFQQVPSPGSNTVQSTSPYRLVQSSNGAPPIGLDGLANVTWRTGLCRNADVRFGISAGVGAVVNPDIQISYLGGATLSIGTYQQFHLTTGIAGTSVDVLKDNYNPNGNIYYSTAPAESLYKQRIKSGLFLSISYTLFTVKGSAPVQNTAPATAAATTTVSK